MLAQVNLPETLIILAYLMAIAYLGWLGYRRTQSASDYLIAGRKAHPFVMAMSYGATFISTSAIVGFGGVAAMFGMSLMWLVFLNIFIGVFVAFVFLGGPTRDMGHRLQAHTFPEFLGRRYQSRFIQIFAGLIIFIFIPLYAAAVMIGGCEFISHSFGLDYHTAILIFSVIIAAYVVVGGLKGVMYTDALQGSIMAVGMIILLIWTFKTLGGVTEANTALTDMAGEAFAGHRAIGHLGWTSMPQFGWGKPIHELWWIVVSTIILGVGIGVLAQPQLAVRFMTVRSKRELNRAVLMGGIFILIMTTVPYTVGALSNVYFKQHEVITGRLVLEPGQTETRVVDVILRKERDVEATAQARLLHIDTTGDGKINVTVIGEGVGERAGLFPRATVTELGDGRVEVRPNSTSFTRAVVRLAGPDGKWMLSSDSIVPILVTQALPTWFGLVFLLTLLAAAMSTLSSQFHALGTAFGRDVIERISDKPIVAATARSINIVRIGIILGIIAASVIAWYSRGGFFIARATAIFFGLCAASFLPAYVGGLFFRRMTRTAAIWSMISGFVVMAFWLTFIKEKEAGSIGIVQHFTGGRPSLLPAGSFNWLSMDPLLLALPVSIIVAIVVSLFTQPPEGKHLDACFGSRK